MRSEVGEEHEEVKNEEGEQEMIKGKGEKKKGTT